MRAKITTALVLALSAALATGPAAWADDDDDDDDRRWKHRHHHAQHHKHHKKHHKHHKKHEHVVHHVYHHQGPARARVERVVPLVTHVTVPSSREECWNEPVVVHHPGSGGSYTPMIVGGIIGGVVGNQVGKGTGNDVATVAGAALGASVGRDIYGGPRGGVRSVHHEQRCRVVDTSYSEERVEGYRVRYRYRGESHWTRMDHHPGDWVKVGVDVRPGRH